MSERRALLDPDMYKISEEDSQDEEVLSSLGCLSLNNFNNNHVEATPRILVPSAPGQNSITAIKKPKRRTGTTLPSLPQSLSNGNKRKLLLEKSKLEDRGDEGVSRSTTRILFDRLATDWPNSTSSETDTSDTESARSGTVSSGTETNGSHQSNSSSSSSSRNNSQDPRGARRHYRGRAQNKTAGNDDDEETLSSSCSSCDTPLNRRHSNSGSSASESDVDEPNSSNGSPHHITEREIQSSTNDEGNVNLVESYTQLDSLKLSEPSSSTARSKNKAVTKTVGGDNVQVDGQQIPSTSKSMWSPYDGVKDRTPADFLPKSKNGKLKQNFNDLKNPQEPLPQTPKEAKSGKGKKVRQGFFAFFLSKFFGLFGFGHYAGRISRFLTRARLDSSGSSKETKGLGTKTKSRKIKMFRFKDEDENGEVREVEMSLTSWDHRTNLGRRATLSESLLGIVPGRFSSSTTIPNSSRTSITKSSDTRGSKVKLVDDRIMVAGFIPGGPAIKTRNVKIGDWLRTVNGNSVNFGNIDSVLSLLQPQDWFPQSIQDSASDSSQRVNLGLQRVAGSLISEETSTQKPQTQTEDEEVVKVKGVHSTSCLRSVIPLDVLSRVALLFITPDPSITNSNEVVFCWPLKTYECEWTQVRALVSSQGMFSTLYQLVRDVTGSHPILSKVQVGADVMEVTYWSDNGGESLLLFAVTVESQGRLLRSTSAVPVMEHLRSAISFRWGTLARAFSEVSEDEMDRFLSNTLAPLVDSKGLFVKEPMALRISVPVQVVLDERLYSFESLDFYAREKLVISHLGASTQVKLYSWMMSELNKWSGQSWEPMKRLILWQRTYLKEKNGTEDPTCSYSVIVGVEHLILAFILEPVVPSSKKRGPDVSWIQKALRTVGRLTRPDILSRINHDKKSVALQPWNFKNGPTPGRQPSPPTPSSAKKKNSTPKEKKVKGGGGSILKNPDLPAQSHFQLPGFSPKLKKSAGQVIKERGGLALLSEEYLASYAPISANKPEVFDELDESTTGTESDAGSLKLSEERSTTGCNIWEGPAKPLSIMKGNILFHFVQMEFGTGVMLSSIGLQEGPYPELFEHFRTTADVTHQILQRAANARKRLRDQDNDKKWVSRSLAPICEHGTLFQCQVTDPKAGLLKTKTKMVNYWVVGRLYSDKRATFLCYQDTTVPQDHVESAFRLAHSI